MLLVWLVSSFFTLYLPFQVYIWDYFSHRKHALMNDMEKTLDDANIQMDQDVSVSKLHFIHFSKSYNFGALFSLWGGGFDNLIRLVDKQWVKLLSSCYIILDAIFPTDYNTAVATDSDSKESWRVHVHQHLMYIITHIYILLWNDFSKFPN